MTILECETLKVICPLLAMFNLRTALVTTTLKVSDVSRLTARQLAKKFRIVVLVLQGARGVVVGFRGETMVVFMISMTSVTSVGFATWLSMCATMLGCSARVNVIMKKVIVKIKCVALSETLLGSNGISTLKVAESACGTVRYGLTVRHIVVIKNLLNPGRM